MKHPRAPELAKLITAIEAAGKPVQAVEVRWEKDAPVWRLVLVGESKPIEEPVKW
jgi:hypothetical protein